MATVLQKKTLALMLGFHSMVIGRKHDFTIHHAVL